MCGGMGLGVGAIRDVSGRKTAGGKADSRAAAAPTCLCCTGSECKLGVMAMDRPRCRSRLEGDGHPEQRFGVSQLYVPWGSLCPGWHALLDASGQSSGAHEPALVAPLSSQPHIAPAVRTLASARSRHACHRFACFVLPGVACTQRAGRSVLARWWSYTLRSGLHPIMVSETHARAV